MAHQVRQLRHGVMVALPLPGKGAVHGLQTSDVWGLCSVCRVCRVCGST
jgi:hypothetical protein